MLPTACPKPPKRAPKPKTPLKRTPLPRSTKSIKKRNEARIARKAKSYKAVIASDFHKELRYVAYCRSNGYCECDQCVNYRANGTIWLSEEPAWSLARTPIYVWYTKKGAKDYLRFRSTEGELHHLTYKYFGKEDWNELECVRFVWKSCHKRLEAEHPTRRRFLKGN